MGILPSFIGISFYSAFVLTIVLAILWEVFEKFIGVREFMRNILLDIILPIVAFAITSIGLILFPIRRDELLVAAGAVLLLFIFTNISGWLAYRRRNRDFAH